MSLFSDVDREDLAKAAVVANTPSSLSSWLQRHPAVRGIAATAMETDILAELAEQLQQQRHTEVSIAVSYALLVALGMQRRAGSGLLGEPPQGVERLTWGPSIWDAMRAAAVPTSTGVIKADVPRIASYSDFGAATPIFGPDGHPIVRRG
jgi:hypothetical protein